MSQNTGSKKSGASAPSAAGVAVAVTGGALLGGVLLYAAKKLYDHVSAKPSQSDKGITTIVHPPSSSASKASTPLSPSDSVRPDLLPDEEPFIQTPPGGGSGHSPVRQSPEGPSTPRTPQNTPVDSPLHRAMYSTPLDSIPSIDPEIGSLHANLLTYYSSDVDIPESEMQDAQEVVEEIKHLFWSCFPNMLPNHLIKDLKFAGSAAEGSHAVRPTDFDILVMLTLDSNIWDVIDAGPTLLAAHGYHIVKRTNLDYFSRGATVYDKYLVSDYLSPSKIKMVLMDVVNRINWGNRYKVQPAVVGSDVKLDVFYGKAEPKKRLEMTFIPAVQLGSTLVVANGHPQAGNFESYDNLWQMYHLDDEIGKLTTPPHGCQLMCLKLLKAVKLNHAAHFGAVTKTALKSAVLLTMDREEYWSEEALGERFIDVLKTLEDYLRAGHLPHHINPKYNILEGLNERELTGAADFIASIFGEGNFSALLK